MIVPSHPNAAPPTSDPRQAPVAPAHGGGIRTGGVYKPKDPHYDPAGKPIEFGSSRVLDQQVGGDLSGLASDPRDDNFIEDNGIGPRRQLQRDIGAGGDNFSGRFSEREPDKPPGAAIEPDGTEDPLAGIDVP